MKRFAAIVTGLFLVFPSTFAYAEDDAKPSDAELKSIGAAVEAMGCKDWDEIDKETKKDGSYHFEVDDAQCADGQYDLKFDKDFKLISKSKD